MQLVDQAAYDRGEVQATEFYIIDERAAPTSDVHENSLDRIWHAIPGFVSQFAHDEWTARHFDHDTRRTV